jgi:hypothetical protein
MSLFKSLFADKSAPINSYADFWNWFQKNERKFYNAVKQNTDVEKDFFDKLSPKLNELQEGFFFLTGMYNDTTVELVLTPDGKIKNIVFVEELVNSAPKIDGWKFTALKPALDIKNVLIEMDGYKFGENNLGFYSIIDSKHPDEINVTVVHDDINKANTSIITTGTYIFLDNFLGELEFATIIDELDVVNKNDAICDIIPISKLKDYLVWRQKEFIEKYSGTFQNTDESAYSVLEAKLQSGNKLIATINTDVLKWDKKASHPWILKVEIKYNGRDKNGMPDDNTYQLLNEIDEEIRIKLKDSDGYLNIGRQTANGLREIYFTCKDFRKPSKVVSDLRIKYLNEDISYEIYKDKYWRSFDRFIPNYD